MMERRGNDRRSKSGHGHPPNRAGRRLPPPSATGLEARYLRVAMKAGRPIELHLADGRALRGPIEAFDNDVITIATDDGPLVVRKSDIRYVAEP